MELYTILMIVHPYIYIISSPFPDAYNTIRLLFYAIIIKAQKPRAEWVLNILIVISFIPRQLPGSDACPQMTER